MKKIALIWAFLMIGFYTFADNPAIVKIKTSAVCSMCKERIEKKLAFTKGVKDVNLNLEDKVVTVTYNAKKTSVDALKKVIAETGYDADDVQKDETSHSKLPSCCQKSSTGMKH
ncbi:heavy-metal-associated domain-containing protein [Flectobacillus major]|uniref:heavy-metal-associated domain-containing protein n=1 Tax=Flectobacillus major TaxID=103 RepID=UPI0004105268|nr:heavy metal-associated domain-containing protein [Flectobacillus major]